MTRRSLVIGMCLSTSLLVGPAQGARAGPPTQPTPRWVNDATLDLKAEVAAAADHGVEELLSDRQLRVGPATEEHHVRRAIRIASPSGVEAPSEVAFDFDPTFERLALHHVRIIRGPRTIDALQRADWKVIQPESDRDKRIYDGELEGLLFLYDVRVGDVVDYAYSITGQSAVSRGHYAERLYLAEGPRVAWLRRRIVIDESRPLLMKLHDATPAVESSVSDQRVYAWERHDVPAIDREDDLPSWYIPLPWVDVSDFASLSDVGEGEGDAVSARCCPVGGDDRAHFALEDGVRLRRRACPGRDDVRARRDSLSRNRDGAALARAVRASRRAGAAIRRLRPDVQRVRRDHRVIALAIALCPFGWNHTS